MVHIWCYLGLIGVAFLPFLLFFLYFISSGICDGDGAPLMVTNMILDKMRNVLPYLYFYTIECNFIPKKYPLWTHKFLISTFRSLINPHDWMCAQT